jgi:hypothetical protein
LTLEMWWREVNVSLSCLQPGSFTARYGTGNLVIAKFATPNLADAIIYTDIQSRRQYTTHIPRLDKRFASTYIVHDITKHHFVLEIPLPAHRSKELTSASTRPVVAFTIRTRNMTNVLTENYPWRYPAYHCSPNSLY